jgi:hypothetical protein
MLPIRLKSRRFPGGFELKPDGSLIADETSADPFIVNTPDLEDPIFIKLLNCVTDEDFHRFANRYYGVWVTSLEGLRADAEMMRGAVNLTAGEPGSGGNLNWINNMISTPMVKPLVLRLDGGSRLVLEATNLIPFMCLEIAAAFEAGAQLTSCQHCSKSILFGPSTGRRSHGKYCGDRCRVAAMRTRNAAKGAAQ